MPDLTGGKGLERPSSIVPEKPVGVAVVSHDNLRCHVAIQIPKGNGKPLVAIRKIPVNLPHDKRLPFFELKYPVAVVDQNIILFTKLVQLTTDNPDLVGISPRDNITPVDSIHSDAATILQNGLETII